LAGRCGGSSVSALQTKSLPTALGLLVFYNIPDFKLVPKGRKLL